MRMIVLAVASAATILSAGIFTSTHAEAMIGAPASVGLAAEAAAPVENVRSPPGFGHGRKVGFRGQHHPPGWAHGGKVGWHHGSMPPGLRR